MDNRIAAAVDPKERVRLVIVARYDPVKHRDIPSTEGILAKALRKYHADVKLRKQVSHGFNQHWILITSTRHNLERFSDLCRDPEQVLQTLFTMKVHIIFKFQCYYW